MSGPADNGGPQHLRSSRPGAGSGGGPTRRSRRARLTATISVLVVLVLVGVLLAVTLGGGGGGKPHGGGTTSTSTATTRTTIPAAPNPSDTHTFLGPDGVEASWVIAENKLPGTSSWRISGQPASGSIDGFANREYAAVGNSVTLYVDSTAPSFKVFAYRMGYYGGTGAHLVWTSPTQAGHGQPTCPVTQGVNMVSCANWKPSLSFTVSSAFVPGDYLLKLVGSGNEQYYILLVVWDPTSHAAYVVKNDLFTEEAWNTYGGYDFYQGLGNCAPTYPVCNRARIVSLDRPMFGNGASDFLANEFPLVAWAEQRGLDVTYADDLTLAQHPSFLLQHRVLLSLGHDECWALPERNAAINAANHGLNIVFFGASAMLRHVRLQGSSLGPDREIVDYRDSSEDPLNGHGNPLQVTGNAWYSPPTDWPESGFVGEMYAGFIEPGDASAPFVVHDAGAWISRARACTTGRRCRASSRPTSTT